MTDWEKFKVAELKEECKNRRISITGLKLKQQFVDKLSEYESSNSADAAPAEESVAEKTNGAIEEVAPDEASPENPNEPEDKDGQEHQEPDITENIPLAIETDKNLPTERPATLKVEDSVASAVEAEEDDVPIAESAQEAKDISKDDMLIPAPEQIDVDQNIPATQRDAEDTEMGDADEKLKEAIKEPEPTKIIDDAEKRTETIASTPDEESRKRKRRSITPPPDAEEVTKKAKAIDGEAIVTKKLSRSPSPKSSTSNQGPSQEGTPMQSPRSEADNYSEHKTSQKSEEQPRQRQRSPSVDKDEIVEPAIHAATHSLYMRNFKRPLNIQILRSHILTIAQGSSSVAQGEDPIKFYNVNNIRSHAFVKFSSIAAASRVRAAMHQTRFPDEPQREPLWIDFVPDEKVENWVDQETSGSRGSSRNSASKLEVVYNDTGEGIEAVFQEVNSSHSQRPSIGMTANNRASVSQRQTSYSADPSRTSAIASGIHPDRMSLVPTSPKINRRPSGPPIPTPQKRHNDQGIGFKGLDDLFSSTEAKPKVYYRLPPQSVIDERLEMIKALFPDRGVTGDPGMKRYTFERENEREEWADNGPEFGHGKRGQDRLVGAAGRGRGGHRGRGGRGGHFSGDSYRGSGRR